MSVKPDEVAIALLFNACAKLTDPDAIKTARDVLQRTASSFLSHDHLVNSAIDMLMKFGDVAQAEDLLKRSGRKTVVSYGALMKGMSHHVHSLCDEVDCRF
jgi:ATP/maltotriose-dependent transcriptional regulator MalT